MPLMATMLLLQNIPAAEAKDVTVNFEVNIDSGSSVGQEPAGSFTYNNSALLKTGFEVADISDFSFVFDSDLYSLADALNPFPEVEFWDGEVTGIFFISNRFSFEVDFFGEQSFAYVGDLARGGDGFGDVTFAAANVPSTPVFEPSITLAFIPSLLALGWLTSGQKRID